MNVDQHYLLYLTNIRSTLSSPLLFFRNSLLGNGPFYYFVQIATLFILLLAANTSYADFPRLSSLLARDGFMPRQLALLGERLVYSTALFCSASLVLS
jgi:amino acid transporter